MKQYIDFEMYLPFEGVYLHLHLLVILITTKSPSFPYALLGFNFSFVQSNMVMNCNANKVCESYVSNKFGAYVSQDLQAAIFKIKGYISYTKCGVWK